MRLALLVIPFLIWAFPTFAGRADKLDMLYEALGLPRIVEIMRTEGLDYGADIKDQMFPGRTSPGWEAALSEIYATDRMGRVVRMSLSEGIGDEALDILLDFFTSDRGQRIVGLEISAREAFLDQAVEDAAGENLDRLRAAGDPQLELIDQFVTANDLVESNVMGAMNSNFAFYLGLMDGGALGNDITESDVLNNVWSQEGSIRSETETWVYSYLTLAYEPLEDADLEAYVALSETKAGHELNRALFDGFDEMYNSISRALGAAAARFMTSEDI